MSQVPAFLLKIADGMIRSEVKKMIEQKTSNAFLTSLLPPPDSEGTDIRVSADIELKIESLDIDYTVRTPTAAEDCRIEWEAEEKKIRLDTTLKLKCPDLMSTAKITTLDLKELTLESSIGGAELKKTMMGVGAVVHGGHFKLRIKGSGSGEWIR